MPSKLKTKLTAAFSKVLALLVVVVLSSYFFSMGLGLFLVYVQPQGVEFMTRQLTALPVSLFMVVNFAIPTGISVGLFFFVLWLLYAGAFVLAWFDRPSFPSSLRNLVAARLDMMRSNYLAIMPQVSSMLLVAVVLIQTLQESAGVQTGGLPPEPPILFFFSVSYAALIEELSYRITTIGLLNGLFLFLKTRKLPWGGGRPRAVRILLMTMWKPEMAKRHLGVKTIQSSGVVGGISHFEWLLLSVTSLAFGAAHYLSGGGWEIGKISTAALSGFAMGFVYLRYGAFAPLLMHWFFNYYFGAFDLASALKLGGFDAVSGGVEVLNIGAGALFVVVLIGNSRARLWTLVRRRVRTQEEGVGRSPNV